jgi:diguanylate cyclase (GGDEF)-like protein
LPLNTTRSGGTGAPRIPASTVDEAGPPKKGLAREWDEEWLHNVIANLPVTVIAFDADGTCTFREGADVPSDGRGPFDPIGRSLYDLFAHDYAVLGHVRRILAGEDVFTCGSDESSALELRGAPIRDPKGRVTGGIVVRRDITVRRRAEQLIESQARVLEMVAKGKRLTDTVEYLALEAERQVPGSHCAVLLLDNDRVFLKVLVAPTLPPELRSTLHRVPVGPGTGPLGAAVTSSAPVTAQSPTAPTAAGADAPGSRYCSAFPIRSAKYGTFGVVAFWYTDARPPAAQDVRVGSMSAHLAAIAVERDLQAHRLTFQALHDPLTGLPNRTLLLDRMGQAIARNRRAPCPVAVIRVDIDRFKVVNDGLGHAAGDKLLVDIAKRFSSAVRPGDTLARLGDDEFVLLYEQPASAHAALSFAERLLEALRKPFHILERDIYIEASVGVSIATEPDADAEDLLRDADAAMFRAKQNGRGRVEAFDETMRDEALHQFSMLAGLRQGIDRKELAAFYQPIVDLADNRCVAVEALARWRHPERGLVAPEAFIPFAEETGLIVPLGAQVLGLACRDAAQWPEQVAVGVNISVRQLAEGRLEALVEQTLQSAGLCAERLMLEITESGLMQDPDASEAIVRRLRSLGVRFALDDFGTGYSSLSYLKRFEIEHIKIDRSFISGLGNSPGPEAIISAVVGMGHALGISVIAEGIETEQQFVAVKGLGCDYGQGFFWSVPVEAADVDSLSGVHSGPRSRCKASPLPLSEQV